MDVRVKALVSAGVVAVFCFLLTFVIWPGDRLLEGSGLAPALGYGLLAGECLAVGAGIAFLAFGYPTITRLPVSRNLADASYVAIGFLLISWWPHDHLHLMVERLDFQHLIWGTAALEYFFHGGMMVCAAILAVFVYRVVAQDSKRELETAVKRPLSRLPVLGNLSERRQFAILAVGIAIVSVPLALMIFPPPKLPVGMVLTPAALVALVGLKVLEGLALGTGIGFVIFAFPAIRRVSEGWSLTLLAYISAAWYLVSWWPHDNLHFVLGANGPVYQILAIEYAFHQTLIAAAVILALFFYRETSRLETRDRGSSDPVVNSFSYEISRR